MLRPIPFFLGLLLLFAVLPTPSHASSKRVTATKAKVNHAAKASAIKASAARTNAKRKAAELRVEPAKPPAESTGRTASSCSGASGAPPASRGPTRIDFGRRRSHGGT